MHCRLYDKTDLELHSHRELDSQLYFSLNKRQRITKGQSKMDNPEKLATQGTQDEDNPEKLATQGTQDEDNPEKLATQGTQNDEKQIKNTTLRANKHK